MIRRPLLALPLLLAACATSEEPTGGASPDAATGAAEAQAAAALLADDRRLALYDLLADDAPAPSARRRPLQADDADVRAAGAVAAPPAALAKARARRDALRAKARARLDGLAAAKAAIAAALAKAPAMDRPGGGTVRVAKVDLAGTTVKVVRAQDAQGHLVHSLVRTTGADGLIATRAETLRPDGGATVRFSHEGADRKSAWTRLTLPGGQLGGGGQLAVTTPDGAARTLIIALKGTEAAPMIVVRDPAVKLEAEVTLPVDGEAVVETK